MKMMKKFGLLVALALIVTVGGVYATWSYSDVSELGKPTSNLALELIQYQVVGGNLTRYGNTNVTIEIDDSNNDHKAELTADGSLIMIFTSAAGTNDASPENIKYTVTIDLVSANAGSSWLYNGEAIFKLTATATTGIEKHLTKIDSDTVTVSGITITNQEGNYYLEITAAEIENIVSLAPENGIVLDDVDAWNAFDSALLNGNIVLTFTPSEATSQS